MEYIELSGRVPFAGDYDIIVAGGGVAGCAAALEAARHGKKTLLIEKSMVLGGLSTLGLVNWWVPMDDGRGTQIIRGMAEELLRLSIKYGYGGDLPEWKDGRYTGKSDPPPRYCTGFSAGIFALVLTDLLAGEGVTLCFDTVVDTPVTREENGAVICDGLVVTNKSGRSYYTARQIIDVTGDADILARAGVPTAVRGNYDSYFGKLMTLESMKAAVEAGDIGRAYRQVSGGGASLYGGNQSVDVPMYDGTDASEVNRYLVRNQRLMLEKLKDGDRKSRDVVQLPGMTNFRTTRRIVGDATLLPEDAFVRREDSIALINDFDRRDYLYEVPYGVLVRTGFSNLSTAGRSASGHRWGWDLLRVIPPAVITGQAIGLAASMAIDGGRPIWDADIRRLQETLEGEDVRVHI